MNHKRGFTLVELLAVIVILAIILVIAVPSISNMIKSASKGAFESDAKMVLNAIKLKLLEDDSFNPTTVNETNISTLLGIGNSNYKSLKITMNNGVYSIIASGKNKWNNLVASGTSTNITTDEGLVLWLDAGDSRSYLGTGTTWYDLSGNNYNANIVGTNAWTSNSGGKFDFGDIAQITQYISLPYQAAQATDNAYTLEIWMQPVATGTYYFNSMSNGSNDNYFLMQQNPTSLQKWSNGSGTEPYTNNEILQFVIVRDNSDTGKLYKNGGNAVTSTGISVIKGTANGGWIFNQEQDSVGGGFVTTENYRGAFMIVKLYNRALSAPEIQQNFNTYRGRFGL